MNEGRTGVREPGAGDLVRRFRGLLSQAIMWGDTRLASKTNKRNETKASRSGQCLEAHLRHMLSAILTACR